MTVRWRRQRGVALVLAMLVMSLATMAAVSLHDAQQAAIRGAGNILTGGQAREYAAGMEDWASAILRRDAAASAFDDPREGWSSDLQPLPIEGGLMRARLWDLQGRYNLNNLAQPGADANGELAVFRRLLANLGLDPGLAEAVADWVDPDTESRLGGAEDDHYLRLSPPYRAANRPMADPSELRLVRGMQAPSYARLAPFVTALPEPTAVNVNSAPVAVLEALAADDGWLGPVLARRGREPIQSLAALQDAGLGLPAARLTTASGYFLLRTHVVLGPVERTFDSLLRRLQEHIMVLQRAGKLYDDQAFVTSAAGLR